MANYGKEEGTKLIANNKKAYHDYFVDVTYECGIELAGTEVKSLRLGQCSIKEAYCNIKNGEVWIYGMHINPYEKGNIFNQDALRDRKLLLHKTEIRKLSEKLKEQGYALIPLRVYFRKSLVKVEIGLCRGKKLYDKRADLQKKQQKRDLERDFKGANLRV
jgi:SsrA-binding protein